ncbi:hypothetical protein Enr10x_19690 [Gimesia panareensis]|uniref:Uncharacterized protein n=1 Tax=Gimesia panareensis TaxID=2527978 RepID=A0A517Q4W7_9PLAN|nr:hypothetical protein [Gimesia panareensis]QDT26659.1 hypothetical protein Enr10x_19690 [Gimesia panareensis]
MQEYRNASQQLTIDFYDIDSRRYTAITKSVVRQFQLEPAGELIIGLDEMFQEFQKEDLRVGLEWDIWSGYIVLAKTESAEDLVREIGAFLQSRFTRAESMLRMTKQFLLYAVTWIAVSIVMLLFGAVIFLLAKLPEPLTTAFWYLSLFVLLFLAMGVIGTLLKLSLNQRSADNALHQQGGRRPLNEIVSELNGREYSLVSLWDERTGLRKVPEIWIFPQDVGEQWELKSSIWNGTHANDESVKRTIALFRETWIDRTAWILKPDEETSETLIPGSEEMKSLDLIEERIGYPAIRKLDYGSVNWSISEEQDEDDENRDV